MPTSSGAKRWSSRIPLRLIIGSVALAVLGTLTACEPELELVVDSAADAVDVAPGDGICETASGTCTLRAAVSEANASPGLDLITIADGIDPVIAIAGTNENLNLTGDIDITDHVIIEGGGATLDANRVDRPLEVTNASADIRDLTITGGFSSLAIQFSGILASGNVTLTRVTVTGNGSGAIFSTGGSLSLVDVVITGNGSGLIDGVASLDGRVSIVSSYIEAPNEALRVTGGSLQTVDSTVRAGTIAIHHDESTTASLTRSTVQTTGSTPAAFAVFSNGGTITATASIIDAPNAVSGQSVCSRPLASGGYNVSSDNTCGLAATGDVAAPPILGPPTVLGGRTRGMVPGAGSPALDRIPVGSTYCDAVWPLDQRGAGRPSGPACDSGAIERQPSDP